MNRLKFVLMAVVACALFAGFSTPAYAQKKQSKEEIEAKIRALEEKKQAEQMRRQGNQQTPPPTTEELEARIRVLEQKLGVEQESPAKTTTTNRPTGPDLDGIIERYEKLLDQCAIRRSDRCADVMYTLGSLYYDKGKENYTSEVERYEREGKRGAFPTPDYSKSFKMYWQLAREYPKFPKLPEAYFQMGITYLVAGHRDSTRIVLEQLIARFPSSPRVSAAHFRLADLAFVDNSWNKAYDHLKKVRKDQIDPTSWEMTHYRLGECAYNIGDFGKAADYFHGYVEACDNDQYQKKEFREMALEYMAIAFSDMPSGVDEAIKFFEKKPGKPYVAQVIYMIGEKNHAHGQWDAAIQNIESALKKYPTHREAPLARKRLDECYAIKSGRQKANTSTVGRSRADIQRIIMQNISTLKYAYDKRLRDKPGLNGKITVKFAIDDLGKVIFIQVVESTIADSELERTVVESVKNWDFGKIDKPGDVTEVTYPFVFSE